MAGFVFVGGRRKARKKERRMGLSKCALVWWNVVDVTLRFRIQYWNRDQQKQAAGQRKKATTNVCIYPHWDDIPIFSFVYPEPEQFYTIFLVSEVSEFPSRFFCSFFFSFNCVARIHFTSSSSSPSLKHFSLSTLGYCVRGYACVCTAMFLNFLFSSFCRSVEYQNAHIQNAFFRPPYTRTHTETQIFAYLLPQTLHKLHTSYSIRCSKHMLRSKLARNIFMYILQGVEWPTRCHITLHKLTSSS